MRLIENSSTRNLFESLRESSSIPSMNDANFEDVIKRDFRLFLMDKYGDELYNEVTNDDINEYFTGMFYDIWDEDDLDSANEAEKIIRNAYNCLDSRDFSNSKEYDDGDTDWSAEEEADALERFENRYMNNGNGTSFNESEEQKPNYVMFYLNGKELGGHDLANEFEGERESARELYASENNVKPEEIEVKEVYKESVKPLTEEDHLVWSNTATEDYYLNLTREEMIQEIKDNGWDEEEINGKPILDADDEELRDYLIPQDIDLDYEDYENSIEPMIEKQCYENILVLSGIAANWRGRGEACKAIKVDDLKSYLMPNYDASIKLYCDSQDNLYYTEANHDTPMGGTEMYLYSLHDESDYTNAEMFMKKYLEDEEFDMYYFIDYINNEAVAKMIESGILKNVKRDPNYVGITESIKNKKSLKEDFWNPGKYFQLLQDEVSVDTDKWNSATQEERDAMVKPQLQAFWNKYKEEMDESDLEALFDDMEDSNFHTEYRILRDIIEADAYKLNESKKPKVKEDKRVIMQQGNVTCFKEDDSTYYVFENESDNEVEYNNQADAMQDFMNRVGVNPEKELNED